MTGSGFIQGRVGIGHSLFREGSIKFAKITAWLFVCLVVNSGELILVNHIINL